MRLRRLISLLVCLVLTATSAFAQVTSRDVSTAIARGVAFLRSSQHGDGHWEYQNDNYNPGTTALGVLALRAAEVALDDPAVQSGLAFLLTHQEARNHQTYQYACMMMALASCDRRRYRQLVSRYAAWLCGTQLSNGMWSYDGRGRGDNSNTQFAVLGLKAAIDCGVELPPVVLRRIDAHFRHTQLRDGGWSYTRGGQATGSMTTAGLTALYVTGALLAEPRKDCGKHRRDTSIERGLAWISKNWSVERNPGRGGQTWHYYYLYGIERVGVLSALRRLGGHDWFREGADFLVRSQQPNGSWGNGPLDTTFALLFLAKGRAPVVINKLSYRGDWNNLPHDLANLTTFVGNTIDKPVTWQIVDVDDPIEVWLEAPILYVSSRSAFKFDGKTREKLKKYIERGGTLIAETVCGSKRCDATFRALVRQMFDEETLAPLDVSHGVYHAHFRVRKRLPIEGVNYGCRTAILYSRKALATVWEANNTSSDSFKLGANMILYAVDKEGLSDRLAETRLEGADTPQIASGALRVGQIKHEGAWFTDLWAMSRLLSTVAERLNVNVSNDRYPVGLLDGDLFAYPILYLEGHTGFELSDEEMARLKLYLERGGFLIAEARCGSPQFDASFRELIRKMFGENRLHLLDPDHPIYRTAFDATRVQYRRAIRDRHPEGLPELEGVFVDNKLAIVYTRYDLGCGWNGQICPGIPGLEPESARALGANIIVYALTY